MKINKNKDLCLLFIIFSFLFSLCFTTTIYSASDFSFQDNTHKYVVTELIDSANYRLAVTAYDYKGRESHYSNKLNYSGVTEITLHWGKVLPTEDLGGYNIYIKQGTEADYSLLVNLPNKDKRPDNVGATEKDGLCFISSITTVPTLFMKKLKTNKKTVRCEKK